MATMIQVSKTPNFLPAAASRRNDRISCRRTPIYYFHYDYHVSRVMTQNPGLPQVDVGVPHVVVDPLPHAAGVDEAPFEGYVYIYIYIYIYMYI